MIATPFRACRLAFASKKSLVADALGSSFFLHDTVAMTTARGILARQGAFFPEVSSRTLAGGLAICTVNASSVVVASAIAIRLVTLVALPSLFAFTGKRFFVAFAMARATLRTRLLGTLWSSETIATDAGAFVAPSVTVAVVLAAGFGT
jgi:hypothetical protein